MVTRYSSSAHNNLLQQINLIIFINLYSQEKKSPFGTSGAIYLLHLFYTAIFLNFEIWEKLGLTLFNANIVLQPASYKQCLVRLIKTDLDMSAFWCFYWSSFQ